MGEVSDLACDDVGFDVAAGTGAEVAEGGAIEGGGDEGDGEAIGSDGGEGEGYAVDGDGAFGDDATEEVGCGSDEFEFDAPVGGVVLDAGDAGLGVDVSLDEVAADVGVGTEGVFEVDGCAWGEVAEGGDGEGFGDGVEGEPGEVWVAGGGEGEAAAGDGDGVAGEWAVVPAFGEDEELCAYGRGRERFDESDVLDEAGEHGKEVVYRGGCEGRARW